MQQLILGLDISTSVTGLCILDNVPKFDSTQNIVLLDAIKFPDISFWEKCDYAEKHLQDLHRKYPNITKICIEEPLKRFVGGKSSIGTIITLQKFNAIICFICRTLWKIDPTYINVSTARKKLGIKTQSKKKCGKNAKEQTIQWVLEHDLSYVIFPKKRGHEEEPNSYASIKDYVKDEVDAFVVAHSCIETCQ